METKRNQKYFASKGINVILIIGLVICLVGIVLLFEQNTRPFGLVILLVGSAVAVFGRIAKLIAFALDLIQRGGNHSLTYSKRGPTVVLLDRKIRSGV